MVAFQCNPGLAPSQQMMSVCAAGGSWTPDPAALVCREPPPGMRFVEFAYVALYHLVNIKQALQTSLMKKKLGTY